MTRITVPPIPDRLTGWRKTITALNDQARGGFAITGEWLQPGDIVDVPADMLIIAVDKTFIGHAPVSRFSDGAARYAATVTLHRASEDGLTTIWTRAFKDSTSALGATTRAQIRKALTAHPAPTGPATVVTEARRPNRKDGACRWCHNRVPAQAGHLVGHGDDLLVEHWQTCPPRLLANGPLNCGLCGVELLDANGYRAPDPAEVVMVREGTGHWEPRHAARLNCTENRLESATERRARDAAARDAEQAAFQSRQAAAQKREDAKARREQARRDAADAEAARVKDLKVTSRKVSNLYDKGLGEGQRARLDEYVDTLSDGTTTTRWAVVTYTGGTVGSFTVDGDWGGDDPEGSAIYHYKPTARIAYQRLKYTPPAREPYEPGGECAECHGGGARYTRFDSSGIEGKVCARCNDNPDYLLSFA
ncbi:hypothetical protein [Parafrankia sp. EUN1f]|uniref:hypothetical protein n=1 Tax=Parafrankia sp. EUN1f TaxID=102897 RepID=UPI0001C46454|nr:hypothetical protein [Parafrankia sp. EUN1f]EFC80884.1 hypothetical protein FrEUN1fDRAFT_5986 [Parafrankia sp. EUN1f]